MKNVIVVFLLVVLCGVAQAVPITLIDNTETGGNGQFEFLGAKTANGWGLSGNGYDYYHAWKATDQVADAGLDTIMPGWVVSTAVDGTGKIGISGNSNGSSVGSDLGVIGYNHYLFSNSLFSFATSTVEMPMVEGNQLHVSFWLRNRDSGRTRVKALLTDAPGVSTGTSTIYHTFDALGGMFTDSTGQYLSFNHTITAADVASGKSYLGFMLYTETGQTIIDDVSLSYTVPDAKNPADLNDDGFVDINDLIFIERCS